MNKHYIYKITCLCGKFKNHYYIGKRTSKNKYIYKYSKDGELIKTWSSIKDIAESFGYKSCGVISELINHPTLPNNNSNNIYSYLWKKAS